MSLHPTLPPALPALPTLHPATARLRTRRGVSGARLRRIALLLAGLGAAAAHAEIQYYRFDGRVTQITPGFGQGVSFGDVVSGLVLYDNTPVPNTWAPPEPMFGTYIDRVRFRDLSVGRFSDFRPSNVDTRFMHVVNGNRYDGVAFSEPTTGRLGDRNIYGVGLSLYGTNLDVFDTNAMPRRLPSLAEIGPAYQTNPGSTIGGGFSYFPDSPGTVSFSITRFERIAAPVPEPETLALTGLGLGLVGWWARRRRPVATTTTPTVAG